MSKNTRTGLVGLVVSVAGLAGTTGSASGRMWQTARSAEIERIKSELELSKRFGQPATPAFQAVPQRETCFCIGMYAGDANGIKPLPEVAFAWSDRMVTRYGLVVSDPSTLVRLVELQKYVASVDAAQEQPEPKPAPQPKPTDPPKPADPPTPEKPAPKEPEKPAAEKPATAPPASPPASPTPPATPQPKPPVAEPALPSLDDLLGTGDQRRPGDPVPDPAEADLDRLLSGEEIGDAFKEAAMLMGDASKRLNESKDASLTTQRLQESIVRRLDQLLSSLDQMQQQQSSSSQQQQQSQEKPQNVPKQQEGKRNEETQGENDGQATQPPGRKDGPVRPGLDAVRSSWGKLPDRVRDMLVQGSSDRFSSIYEGMTEAYYKKLAEQGKAK